MGDIGDDNVLSGVVLNGGSCRMKSDGTDAGSLTVRRGGMPAGVVFGR